MKTAEDYASIIGVVCNIPYKNKETLIKELKQFEKKIRADERETRIKELNSMGEFKTDDEAKEYCRLHGLDIHTTIGNVFRIAGALMDARKDQDKVTRHACAEIVLDIQPNCVGKDLNRAHQAIMNVKTI